jgi:predicted nucleic-acid-binding protein
MKITADANLLVRIVVRDDERQANAALDALESAEAVFLTVPSLCEFAWVLSRTYKLSRRQIASSIRAVVERGNVSTDLAQVRTGLRVLEAGGDFADGAIAAAGAAKGSENFVSFDRDAVTHLRAIGMPAELLAPLEPQ